MSRRRLRASRSIGALATAASAATTSTSSAALAPATAFASAAAQSRFAARILAPAPAALTRLSGRPWAAAGDGFVQGDNLTGSQAFDDLRVRIVRDAEQHRTAFELVLVLDEDKAFAAFGEHRGQWHGQDVVGRRHRNAEDGGHARTHARVDALDGDAGGESLDAVLDDGLGRDALHDALHPYAGHGLGLNLQLASVVEADDVGLVDMGVDDHVV